MGGGHNVIDDQSLLILKAQKELDLVSFYVDPITGNMALFNRDRVYESLCKDVQKYFKDCSIRCVNLGPVEKGGGGFQSMGEIFALLVTLKGFIEFTHSIINWIRVQFVKHVEGSNDSFFPRVGIGLSIRTNAKISQLSQDNLNYIFLPKLANLLSVGAALCQYLREKYGYLYCDLSLSGTIHDLKYSVQIDLPDKHQGKSTIVRMMKMIVNLRLRKNQNSDYSMTNLFAIKRVDSRLELIDHASARGPQFKNYYLLFSSKLLKDYR